MLIPLLLAFSVLSADPISATPLHRSPRPKTVTGGCQPTPPVYTVALGVGGLAAGIGLFMPTAKAVAGMMGCGSGGYSCMGSGMFGALAGMGVVVALPVIGFKMGYKLDSERENRSDCVSFELIIPIDGRSSPRKAAGRPTSSMTALAYSPRETCPGQ